jgi:hypothetical protein
MTIIEVPSGVDADVEMVTFVEHGGAQDAGVKVACAPAGRPPTLKGTTFVVPPVSVATTVFDTDDPLVTDRLPALPRAQL